MAYSTIYEKLYYQLLAIRSLRDGFYLDFNTGCGDLGSTESLDIAEIRPWLRSELL